MVTAVCACLEGRGSLYGSLYQGIIVNRASASQHLNVE